jgi:hypothetical protein
VNRTLSGSVPDASRTPKCHKVQVDRRITASAGSGLAGDDCDDEDPQLNDAGELIARARDRLHCAAIRSHSAKARWMQSSIARPSK